MNGRRTKWINKLVSNRDPGLLLSIRSRYGDKTSEFGERQIVKAARKMWKDRTKGVENWGNLNEGGK